MGFVVGQQDQAPQMRIASVLVLPLLVVFVVVVLVFRVLYQVVTVDGASMEPTLYSWDYLLATKAYDTPKRWDIVSIASSRPGAMPIIKRIVRVFFVYWPPMHVRRLDASGGSL